MRQTDSPMIVERRWPTCISFAMFGEEKSTRQVKGETDDGLGSFPVRMNLFTWSCRNDGVNLQRMKPILLTSRSITTGWFSPIASITDAPMSEAELIPAGRQPDFLKSAKRAIAAVHW